MLEEGNHCCQILLFSLSSKAFTGESGVGREKQVVPPWFSSFLPWFRATLKGDSAFPPALSRLEGSPAPKAQAAVEKVC